MVPGAMPSLVLLCPTSSSSLLGVGQVALEWAAALRRSGVPVRLEEGWLGVRTQSALRARVAKLHAGCRPGEVLECPAPWGAALPRGGVPVVHRSTQPDLAYLAAEGRGAPLRQKLQLGATALQVLSGWSRVDGFLCLGSAERAWMASHAPWLAPRLHTYLHAPPAQLRTLLKDVARRRTGAPAGKTRWLWMGRWTAHKGPETLVQFLEERLARHPGEAATLAGTGRIPELPPSLRGRVAVLPRYEREALPGLLASHDAGLFTSVAEGWGLSLQEMLESGLPVYATHVGAAVDLAPYFPRSLRPFPPLDSAERVEPGGLPREGYAERFSWDVIASDAAAWLRALSG